MSMTSTQIREAATAAVRALNLSGARIPKTSLRHTNLTDADLSHADCSGVDFTGAVMERTKLDGTILRGAVMEGVKKLTKEQLKSAVLDERTVLPGYLK